MLDDGVMLVLVFFLVPSPGGYLRSSSPALFFAHAGIRVPIVDFLFFVGAEGGGCGDGVEIAGPLNPPLHYSRFFKSRFLAQGIHTHHENLCTLLTARRDDVSAGSSSSIEQQCWGSWGY